MQLRALNTLALDCVATQFKRVRDSDELTDALQFFIANNVTPVVLGDGSNIVFSSAQLPACIKLESKGIELVEESASSVVLDIAGGENWNDLVNSCLAAGYYGLENLALIPGTVGAAPVQNIGAYGIELSEFVEQLVFRDLCSAQSHTYSLSQCEFAYRDSVFKRKLRDATIIENVRLRLFKQPRSNRNYTALAQATQHLETVSPLDIRDAVVKLRSEKLPDPRELANAGSFFKNPIVDAERLAQLQEQFPSIVAYPTEDPNRLKLAAAWLIDQAGWRGRGEGSFAMHQKQALVLVNRGGRQGKDLLEFAERVRASVRKKFMIELHIEPRIY